MSTNDTDGASVNVSEGHPPDKPEEDNGNGMHTLLYMCKSGRGGVQTKGDRRGGDVHIEEFYKGKL